MEDLDPGEYHEDLHRAAQTCRALYHVAQPLRRHHLWLSAHATRKLANALIDAWAGETDREPVGKDILRGTRFLCIYGYNSVMSPALYPLLPPLVSLRLSLPPFDTVDLTDLVVIAGMWSAIIASFDRADIALSP